MLTCIGWAIAAPTGRAETSLAQMGRPTSKLLAPRPAEPAADTASCKIAHELAPKLLKQLDLYVDPIVRQAAYRYVAEKRPGYLPAKAWSDFASVVFLRRDWLAASWAGLNALKIQWNGEFQTNAAVYLIDLGRGDDALVFLNCAYADGYRSPYLFEALAAVYRRRGEKSKTSLWIHQAAAAAPDDVNIQVEQSLADTGAPPSSPPPAKSPPDALDQALAELRQHAARVAQTIQILQARIDQVEDDPLAKQSRDLILALTYRMIDQYVSFAEDAVKRARAASDASTRSGAAGRAGYDRLNAVMRNQAVLACIEYYAFITEALVRTVSGDNVDGPGWRALFWANVLYMDPVELEREQKLRLETGSGVTPQLESSRSAEWFALDHGPRTRFDLAAAQSSRQRQADWNACGRRTGQENSDCMTRAEKANCDRVRSAFDVMMRADTERYDNSARHFDLVARATMIWGERQLADFRDYARRYLKLLKTGALDTSRMPGPRVSEAQLYQRNVGTWWRTLRDEVINVNHPTHSVAKFLHDEASRWRDDRGQALTLLANTKNSIETGSGGYASTAGCAAVDKKYLELLAEEQWKEYLETLKDNLKDDFQTSYDPMINWEDAIGPITVSLDENGKFSITNSVKHALGADVDAAIEHEVDKVLGKAGGEMLEKELGLKRTLSFKDQELEGGEVSIASGAVGQGIEAEGEATLFTGKNERTGKWDAGIAVTFKSGVGFKRQVSAFGHKFDIGLACYPGTASAKFYARAAFDDAAALIRAAVTEAR